MPVLVKKLGYLSHKGGKAAGGMSKLKSHLKYLQHGKIHETNPRRSVEMVRCSGTSSMTRCSSNRSGESLPPSLPRAPREVPGRPRPSVHHVAYLRLVQMQKG